MYAKHMYHEHHMTKKRSQKTVKKKKSENAYMLLDQKLFDMLDRIEGISLDLLSSAGNISRSSQRIENQVANLRENERAYGFVKYAQGAFILSFTVYFIFQIYA